MRKINKLFLLLPLSPFIISKKKKKKELFNIYQLGKYLFKPKFERRRKCLGEFWEWVVWMAMEAIKITRIKTPHHMHTFHIWLHTWLCIFISLDSSLISLAFASLAVAFKILCVSVCVCLCLVMYKILEFLR